MRTLDPKPLTSSLVDSTHLFCHNLTLGEAGLYHPALGAGGWKLPGLALPPPPCPSLSVLALVLSNRLPSSTVVSHSWELTAWPSSYESFPQLVQSTVYISKGVRVYSEPNLSDHGLDTRVQVSLNNIPMWKCNKVRLELQMVMNLEKYNSTQPRHYNLQLVRPSSGGHLDRP